MIDDDYCEGVLESEFDGFDCQQQGLFVDYVNTTTSDEQGEVIEIEGPLFNNELNKLTIQIGENLYQLDFEKEEYFYASSILETDPTVYYSRSTFNRLSSPFVNLIKEFKRDEVINQYQIFVNGENNNEALNVFRNILSQNGIENLQNIENIVNTNYLINQFARFIGLISFSLVIMIIIIAISNLINSVNHSMSMRLRETGILLSSGMTLDSFVRMIITEVALFGFWAIIIGVPVAILITWITSSSLDLNLGSMHSQWLSMTLISVLLVILMMLLSVILNVSTLRKYDITTLTKD